ncbi:hypothetical protein PMA78_002189 [Escherichia coli]|uniref:hypothetical protein n=1 Tax=Escherichia coli TaxID=562 RepID=UPI0013D76D5D|nr:hypothetical protein [Escherichia coli]EKK2197937.1 hypothetical protein [Escherichia coli]NEV42207.1 hypothetical protein [Escherichia coli]HBA8984641.1 hypothetical protein [Escherichia coli]HBA9026467.1 hypothetical protein [Escherichia coli]HBA9058373.1 hypothetical protein [Escherichia coli]
MHNLFEQWPLFKPNTPGNSNYFPDNLSITDMVFWFDNNAKKLLDVIKKTTNHEQKQMFIQHLTSTLYNNKVLNNPYHLEPQKISNEQIALPIINILYDNSDVFHKESILFFSQLFIKNIELFDINTPEDLMIFDSPDASSIFDTQGYLSTYHVQPDLLDYKNKIIILLVKFLNHINEANSKYKTAEKKEFYNKLLAPLRYINNDGNKILILNYLITNIFTSTNSNPDGLLFDAILDIAHNSVYRGYLNQHSLIRHRCVQHALINIISKQTDIDLKIKWIKDIVLVLKLQHDDLSKCISPLIFAIESIKTTSISDATIKASSQILKLHNYMEMCYTLFDSYPNLITECNNLFTDCISIVTQYDLRGYFSRLFEMIEITDNETKKNTTAFLISRIESRHLYQPKIAAQSLKLLLNTDIPYAYSSLPTLLNILQKTVYEPGHLELLDKVLKLCAKNIQASEFDSLLELLKIYGNETTAHFILLREIVGYTIDNENNKIRDRIKLILNHISHNNFPDDEQTLYAIACLFQTFPEFVYEYQAMLLTIIQIARRNNFIAILDTLDRS